MSNTTLGWREDEVSKTDSSGNVVDVSQKVSGPLAGVSTDNAVMRWNGTGGRYAQNSGVIVDDSNNITNVGIINAGGAILNTIKEKTTGGGITIPHTIWGNIGGFSGGVATNSVSEYNGGVGVSVDGCLLKDGTIQASPSTTTLTSVFQSKDFGPGSFPQYCAFLAGNDSSNAHIGVYTVEETTIGCNNFRQLGTLSGSHLPVQIDYRCPFIVQSTVDSVSSSTGALTVAGGVGVAGDINCNSSVYVNGNLHTDVIIEKDSGAGVQFGLFTSVKVNKTTASSSTSTGALTVAGGIGVGGSIYTLSLNAINNTYTRFLHLQNPGDDYFGITFDGGSNIIKQLSGQYTFPLPVNATAINSLSIGSATGTGTLNIKGNGVNAISINDSLTQAINPVYVSNTTVSSSKITGALRVAGGVGIAGHVYSGGYFHSKPPAGLINTIQSSNLFESSNVGITGNYRAACFGHSSKGYIVISTYDGDLSLGAQNNLGTGWTTLHTSVNSPLQVDNAGTSAFVVVGNATASEPTESQHLTTKNYVDTNAALISSAAWTPTVTVGSGTTAVTVSNSRYERVGNTVTWHCQGDATFTNADVLGLFSMTLPVALGTAVVSHLGSGICDLTSHLDVHISSGTTIATIAGYPRSSGSNLFVVGGSYVVN